MSDESEIGHLKGLLEDPRYFYEDAKAKFNYVIAELRKYPQRFFRFYGLSPYQFDELLKIITRPDLVLRSSHPGLHLSITLRYFSSKDNIENYSELFGVCKSDNNTIITAVCDVILGMRIDLDFLDNAFYFEVFWNFPNCAGAIDGRRFLCQHPTSDGGTPYDLHVLFLVDANFRCFDSYFSPKSRENLEREFLESAICNELEVTTAECNVKMKRSLPMVFVGGKHGFARKNIIRAFHGNNLDEGKVIFNYRHGRAMNVVDTALGILFKRWQIFQLPLIGNPEFVMTIVQCLLILHNWLINEEKHLLPFERFYMPMDVLHDKDENGFYVVGNWGQYSVTESVQRFQSDTARGSMILDGMRIRDEYVEYFLKDGTIPGQYKALKQDEIETSPGAGAASAETAQRANEYLLPADTQQWDQKAMSSADTSELAAVAGSAPI